jgi:hypothetical protein
MALLAWLAMFLVTSVAAGHYAQFGPGGAEKPRAET